MRGRQPLQVTWSAPWFLNPSLSLKRVMTQWQGILWLTVNAKSWQLAVGLFDTFAKMFEIEKKISRNQTQILAPKCLVLVGAQYYWESLFFCGFVDWWLAVCLILMIPSIPTCMVQSFQHRLMPNTRIHLEKKGNPTLWPQLSCVQWFV